MKIVLTAVGFLVASVAGDGIRGGVLQDEISVWADHGAKEEDVGVLDGGTHGAEAEDGGEDGAMFAVPWDDDIEFDEEKYLDAGDNALPWVVDGVGFSSVDEYLEYAHGRRVTDHPYFRRMLDENGDPVAPSNKDFTELLVAELEYQRAVNGTVDPLEAMASVAQQIVFKAIEADETGDNRTEWIMEHLTISEQGTPEALEMAKIIAENANHTACEIPGECVTQARLKIVKNWIEDYLNNCIQTGTELDLDYMYQRLFAETDVDPQSADELIQSSPAIRDQIDYMIQEADIAARENELAPRAELVEKALIDAGNNMTDFEDTLEEIGFSEEEVSVLLRSLAPERLAKVEEAIRKPKEDYEAQVYYAFEKLANGDNHTYFEEAESTEGERRLNYVPRPDDMRIEDHQRMFKDKIQRRRRLSVLPQDTADFESRLRDHVEELQGHARELTLSCDAGESSAECLADGLVEYADKIEGLIGTGGSLVNNLSSLSTLLTSLANSQGAIDDVDFMADSVYVAFKIAAKFPSVGTIFKVIENALKPIKEMISKVDQKADRFKSNILNVWKNSIEVVEKVMETFDSSKLFALRTGANVLAAARDSVCVTTMIEHVGGNVLDTMELVIDHFRKYLETFYNSMKRLDDVLNSQAWKDIQQTLSDIVSQVEPLDIALKPLNGIVDLLKEEVEIKPWASLPIKQQQFGKNQCPSGYHRGLDQRICWENNSKDWVYWPLSIPPKMMWPCSRGNMGKVGYDGVCANSSYRRNECKLKWYWNYKKIRLCRPFKCWDEKIPWGGKFRCERSRYRAEWWTAPRLRCAENCRSGYSNVVPGRCFKKSCPHGWSHKVLPSLCFPRTNDRRFWKYQAKKDDHNLLCKKYNGRKRDGTGFTQDIFGTCFGTCAAGETLILGWCVPLGSVWLSLQDITNAFTKIFDFIEGLPIVKEILAFIDDVIRAVLGDIIDIMEDQIKKLLNLPTFPDIDLDLLPFKPFDLIPLDMPELPEIAAFTNLPGQLYGDFINQVPAPFKYIGDCATDIECVAKQLGVDMTEMLDTLADVAEALDGIEEYIGGIVDGINCTAFTNKTLPVSDVLAKMNLPDCNDCDIEIPWCEQWDLSGIQQPMDDITGMFKSLLNGPDRRRLLGINYVDMGLDSDTTGWMPLLALELDLQALGNMHSRQASAEYNIFTFINRGRITSNDIGWSNSYSSGRYAANDKIPVGFHFRFETKFFFSLGLIQENGEIKFGMDVGAHLEGRFARSLGPYQMIKKAIELAEDINEVIYEHGMDGYIMCELKWKEFGTRSRSHKYFAACNKLREAHRDVGSANRDYPECKTSEMGKLRDKAYEFRFKNLDKATTKKIIDCVDYWVLKTKDVRNLVSQYHNEKVYVDIANDNHGLFPWDPIRAYREKIGYGQDFNEHGGIRRFLKLHSGMITRQLGSKLAPIYKIGQDSFSEMINFGAGFEVKDHDYGARFGPYAQVGSLGFPQDWTFQEAFQMWDFGELSLSQVFDIVNSRRNGDPVGSVLASGTNDVSTGQFFRIEVRGVIDPVGLVEGIHSNPTVTPGTPTGAPTVGPPTYQPSSYPSPSSYLLGASQRQASMQLVASTPETDEPMYVGCYKDTNDRGLPVFQGNMYPIDTCTATCKLGGYHFAAMQNWKECFCGAATAEFDKHGHALEMDCKSRCKDKNGYCGAGRRNSVWTTGFSGQDQQANYVGCFMDAKSPRALTHRIGPGKSIDDCRTECHDLNFKYAALQNADYCFCGNAGYDMHSSKLPESNCQKDCKYGSGKCGGGYRNSVYLTGYKPSSEYIGCFKDSSPRALEVHLGNGFTLDGCIEDCFNKGFKYAGLQFKSECRCGHTGYDKYGGVRPESECSMDCTTGSGICGGPGRNSVYATGFEPIAEYKGCYKDQSDRALSHKVGPNQSLDECKTKCQDKGYYYFALQSGNYCFCGAFDDDFDKYGKVNDSECDGKACKGGGNTGCGGGWRNALWKTGLK